MPHRLKLILFSFLALICILSLPAVALADSLIIKASVPARVSDFQLQVASSQTTTVGPNTVITYTITYGWLGTNPTDLMVIQANWSLGQFGLDQVPIVEYSNGSASPAMGQFAAQYDVSGRSLTWNISPVAIGPGHKVTFKLITKTVSSGKELIPFSLSFRLLGPGIALPWQTINQTYQEIISSVPSPSLEPTTPKPGPAAGSTSRFPGLGRVPIIGPPLQKALDGLDKISKHNGSAAAVPLIALSLIPWLLTIIPGLFSILPGLNISQIISLIGILFWRRQRHPWGVVYDAKTKLPLDPVLLTLFSQNGHAHQTISDIYGRYQFIVEPGQYWLKAQKSHYSFPSVWLKQAKSDQIYQDLYYGQAITVTNSGTVAVNIPMDPDTTDWNQQAKQHSVFGRQARLQHWGWYLFIGGVLWSVLMALLTPTPVNVIILAIYVVLLVSLLWYRHDHSWGIIYNRSRQPVAGAVVSLLDLDHPQIKHPPVVTTNSGKYAFLTDKGTYQVKVSTQSQTGTIWPAIATPPIHQSASQGHIAKDIEIS